MPADRRSVLKSILAILLSALAGFLWWQRQQHPSLRASNERNASACLKILAAAEVEFRTNDRDRNGIKDFWTGDVTGLFAHGALIDSHLAHMDSRPIMPPGSPPWGQWGYYLVAMDVDESQSPPEELRQETDKTSGKVHHLTKFALCAYPAEYGVSGRQTFIINEGATIYKCDTGGRPVLRWPGEKDLLAEWIPLD